MAFMMTWRMERAHTCKCTCKWSYPSVVVIVFSSALGVVTVGMHPVHCPITPRWFQRAITGNTLECLHQLFRLVKDSSVIFITVTFLKHTPNAYCIHRSTYSRLAKIRSCVGTYMRGRDEWPSVCQTRLQPHRKQLTRRNGEGEGGLA